MAQKRTGNTFRSSLAKLSGGSLAGTRSRGTSPNPSAGLRFGRPSNSGASATATPQSGMDWTKLLPSSGGASGFLKGGLASVSGIGSIVSGLTSLFGGGSKKNTVPALPLFSLPDTANQTVHMQTGSGGGGSTVHVHVQTMDSQSFLNRSNDIAQAVKSAMLNSHSLNDVISEM